MHKTDNHHLYKGMNFIAKIAGLYLFHKVYYVNLYINACIFYSVDVHRNKMTKMDVFIGYHADTCASIILYICHELCEEHYDDSNSNSSTSDDCEEEEEETDDIDEWVDDNKDKVCNLEEKTKLHRNVNLKTRISAHVIYRKPAYSY